MPRPLGLVMESGGIQSGVKGGCQADEHPGLYNMVMLFHVQF